jgi:hypothetical protein
MFDWFKNSEHKNVVSLPFPKPVIVPYVEPPKEKEQEYYSIGVTSEGKMTFKTGITTLTMTRKGCEDLIEQLTVFKNQMHEDEDDAS